MSSSPNEPACTAFEPSDSLTRLHTITAADVGLIRGARNQLALDGHGRLADRLSALLRDLEPSK